MIDTITMPTIEFPAEWFPQDAIQFAWPHAGTDWQPWLSQVEQLYAELCANISHYQGVVLVLDPSVDQDQVIVLLSKWQANLSNLYFYTAATNDTWARDHGPISVLVDGLPQILDFQFNAWGGKFDANHDNLITGCLAEQGAYACPVQAVGLVLEGGSIESDGQGSILTTTACLLNPNRNPSLNQQQIEQALQRQLGSQRVLWLSQGHLAGDDTDSHIDTLARFVAHDCIAYVQCLDASDPHFTALSAMEQQLQALRQANGQPYKLVPLPMPSPKYSAAGDMLPATYANFLITNERVFMPTYQDPQDQPAIEALQSAFGERRVVGIDCSVLIEQYGSLHCISMQLPKGVLSCRG